MDDQIKNVVTNEPAGLNGKDLFYKYVRFLPLFIVSIALGLLVAYVYLRYATLVYSSVGSLVLEEGSTASSSNDKMDALFESDSKKNIDNEIEYMRSRQILNRVVKALNLNWSYYAKGNIKEVNIYKESPFRLEAFEISDSSTAFTLKVTFENDNAFRINNSETVFHFGQVFKNEYGVFRLVREPKYVIGSEYKVVYTPTFSVVTNIVTKMAISPKTTTAILVIRLEGSNPFEVADVINQLMTEYQKATIMDKNAETQNRINFIDKELDTVSRQVDSISNVLQNFVIRNRAFDLAAQSSNYLAQIQKTNEDIQAQTAMLNNARLVEGYIQNKRGDIPVPSSLGLEDPTLNDMVSAYNTAQIERKTLMENAPAGNIAVRQKDEIISRLQKNILESISNIKKSYTSSIGSLQSIAGSAQAGLGSMPELQKAVTDINRQLDGKLKIYESLLIKREETAITLASTISNIKVLQDAIPSTMAVKPNPSNVRILAALAGLLIPALFIFILELLNDKINTRADVERLTSAPVIGEIGHSYSENTLVATSNNRGVVAEQFRIIRSNLQYVLNHTARPVIMVTSSFSGEGKSFISTNTGAVMALAGRKTIILEFDIRKPKILSHLSIPKKPGLTNYLLGKITLDQLPIPVEGHNNLFVLACGPVPPNPAELLLDPKLNDLFAYLRENFEVVIIDTAPVGMVSDAMTLSKFADSTLYIVRQGHTFKKQIGLIDELHIEGKLPKVSIILNDVKIRTGYGYYGYGRYGYGHGYTSTYYEEEAPPPGFLERWFSWIDFKKLRKKIRKPKRA